MNKRVVIFIFFSLISFSAGAWNAMGHRIIGEIAYEHLRPKAKQTTDDLIDYMANAYPYSSTFQTANGWADTIKQNDVHVFDSWHFYDKPYTTDNTPIPQTMNPPHLLWALNQSIVILKSPKSSQYEKALFLRFLLHLTGDAHQPLHSINRYSQHFPNGDEGGNLFLLSQDKSNTSFNLHGAWDNGLGLFDKKCGFFPSKSKAKKARCLAEKFQSDYPESYFAQKINNLNPADWLDESYQLAMQNAYNTNENETLSEAYLQKNQTIVEQQVTLAGYRLANLLNSLFS